MLCRILFFFVFSSFSCEKFSSTTPRVERPRLILTKEKLKILKEKVHSGEKTLLTQMYEEIKADVIDWCTNRHIPTNEEYQKEVNETADGTRIYGNYAPTIALMQLLEIDPNNFNFFECNKRWMDAYVSWEPWATNVDISAAHLAIAMAFSIDWMYDMFNSTDLAVYGKKLSRHLDLYYESISQVPTSLFWSLSYTQNHNHVNFFAIAAATFSMYGEEYFPTSNYTRFQKWIDENDDGIKKFMPLDGSAVGGVSYWTYSLFALNSFYSMQESFLGIDVIEEVYKKSEFWKNTGLYRLYLSDSTEKFNQVLQIADTSSSDGSRVVFALFRLASIFNNGHYQWLAKSIYSNKNGASAIIGQYSWALLLFYDDSIVEMPISTKEDFPLGHYFTDLNLLISRDSWIFNPPTEKNNNIITQNPSIFSFKAGPPYGNYIDRHFYENILLGDAHAHPDEGNFLYSLHGKRLLLEDGYNHLKLSKAHNVMTFNFSAFESIGQMGEGNEWFNIREYILSKGSVKILFRESVTNRNKRNPGYEYIVADLTYIYPLSLGVDKYYRHVLFYGKKYIIIIDVISRKMNEIVKLGMTFNLHSNISGDVKIGTDGNTAVYEDSVNGNGYVILSDSVCFSDESCRRTSAKFFTEDFSYPNDDGGDTHHRLLRIYKDDVRDNCIMHNVIVPFTSKKGVPKTPTIVVSTRNEYIREVIFDDCSVVVDLQTFTVNPPGSTWIKKEWMLPIVIVLAVISLVLFLWSVVSFFGIFVCSYHLMRAQKRMEYVRINQNPTDSKF